MRVTARRFFASCFARASRLGGQRLVDRIRLTEPLFRLAESVRPLGHQCEVQRRCSGLDPELGSPGNSLAIWPYLVRASLVRSIPPRRGFTVILATPTLKERLGLKDLIQPDRKGRGSAENEDTAMAKYQDVQP